MKKLLFVVAFAAATVSVKAQDEDAKPLRFSIGADVALPVGEFIDGGKFSDLYSVGVGATVKGTYALDTDLGVSLSLGYMSYMGKKEGDFKYASLGAIPILAGIEYNFTPQFFATAELGYSIYTGKMLDKDETEDISLGALAEEDLKLSGFTYAPGIGYRFTPNFSAALRYQGSSVKLEGKDSGGSSKGNLSQIGLRIAYTF